MQDTENSSAPKRPPARLRFSLRSLLLAVLLIGSTATLRRNWEPWHLVKKLRGHSRSVDSAKFSNDGKTVLTNSTDGTARLWNVNSGVETNIFTMPKTKLLPWVLFAEFSPDEKFIVCSSGESGNFAVIVWDVHGTRIMDVDTDTGASVKFSPDGKSILVLTDNDSGRLIDATTGTQLFALKGRRGGFFPDGTRIFTTHNETRISVWDAKTGGLQSSITLDPGAFDVEISPDGKLIAVCQGDGPPSILAADSLKKLDALKQTSRSVHCMHCTFSRDGKFILTNSSLSRYPVAKLWSLAENIELGCLMHSDAVASVRFFPAGDQFLTGCNDGTVRIWDLESLSVLATIGDRQYGIWDTNISKDGKNILIANGDKEVAVWSRRRPEYWWGLAWLPEFWLTAGFAIAVIWSLRRDYLPS